MEVEEEADYDRNAGYIIESSSDDEEYDENENQVEDEDERILGGWMSLDRFIEETSSEQFPVKFSYDATDKATLSMIKSEAKQLLGRWMKLVHGESCRRSVTNHGINLEDITELVFRGTFLSKLLSDINWCMDSGSKVSGSEFFEFVRVEIRLMDYGTSPTEYFEGCKLQKYLPVGMQEARYNAIYKALCKSQSRRSAAELQEHGTTWLPPRYINSDLPTLSAELRETGRILAVAEKTDVTFDDDMLAKRSRTVKEAGIASTSIQLKGRVGPTSHVAASSNTGIHIGSYIQLIGDEPYDCVMELLKSMISRDFNPRSQQLVTNHRFFMDRWYSMKKIRNLINKANGEYVATVKRCKSSPYLHGPKWTASAKRTKLDAIGSSMEWTSVRAFDESDVRQGGRTHEYYTAYRTGLGNIFYMITNSPEYVRHYNIVPYPNATETKPYDDNNCDAFSRMQHGNGVQNYTTGQSEDKAWFYMRPFTISSTAAVVLCSCVARNSVANQEPVSRHGEQVLKLLGCKVYSRNTAFVNMQSAIEDGEFPDEFADRVVFSEAELSGKSNEELKEILRNQGKQLSGNKVALIARIIDGGNVSAVNVLQLLVRKWFLTPWGKGNTNLSDGLWNEKNIIKALPKFVSENTQNRIFMNGIVTTGLQGRINSPWQVSSIDGEALIKQVTDTGEEVEYWAGIEFKTATSTTSGKKADRIQHELGYRYAFIEVGFNDRQTFKTHVKLLSHRCQLLCHGATLKHRDMFYVVATTTYIVRVVHVRFIPLVLTQYDAFIKNSKEQYLSFFWDSFGSAPELDDYGYCRDRATFLHAIEMCKNFRAAVNDRGCAFPKLRFILPMSASLYNIRKNGVDQFSSDLKFVQPRHQRQGIEVAIKMRYLYTAIHTIFKMYLLASTYNYLVSDACTSYRKYQRYRSKQLSFTNFLWQLSMLDLHTITKLKANTEVAPAEAINRSAFSLGLGVREVRYGVAKHVTEDAEAQRKRLDGKDHYLVSISKALHCVLCCDRERDDIQHHPHYRKGFKSCFKCSKCNSILCKTKRWSSSGELINSTLHPEYDTSVLTSCFDYWHQTRDILLMQKVCRGPNYPFKSHNSDDESSPIPPNIPESARAFRLRSSLVSMGDEEDEDIRVPTKRQRTFAFTTPILRTSPRLGNS